MHSLTMARYTAPDSIRPHCSVSMYMTAERPPVIVHTAVTPTIATIEPQVSQPRAVLMNNEAE